MIPYKKNQDFRCPFSGGYDVSILPADAGHESADDVFVDNTSAELATTMGQENLFLNILFVALLPAFVEEFVFRGVFYQTYRKSSMKAALVLSGLLFGCMHMNFNQFLYTFVFGMILVFMMEATGSIVTSMICHFY